MSSPTFQPVSTRTARADLIELNVEYMSWVFGGIDEMFGINFAEQIGVSARDYIPTVIDEICGQEPPEGIFYLVRVNGNVAGMGGLCRTSESESEIKRIYVRKEHRGNNYGELLLHRLIEDARSFRYQRVRLNSALFMNTAHRIYERNGFTDCGPYEGAEVPPEFMSRWRFMVRQL